MTDHTTLKMHREHVRVTDREMLMAMLDLTCVANVSLHDEPYPYTVPMNFGYTWPEDGPLTFYFHMARDGHRIELVKQNPAAAVCVWTFLDRVGHKPFQKESHDYRSVMAYGEAEIIDSDEDEEGFLFAMAKVHTHSGRPAMKKVPEPMKARLGALKITCQPELVMGKAQYDIFTVEDVAMPSVEDVDAGLVFDPKANSDKAVYGTEKADPDMPPHATE